MKLRLLTVTVLCALVGAVRAQEAPDLENVSARLEVARSQSTPTEPIAHLTELELGLREADRLRGEAGQFQAETDAAPETLRRLRAALSAPPEAAPLPDGEGLSLEEVVALHAQAAAERETARAKLVELDLLTTQRAERRLALPGEIAEARGELVTTQEQFAGIPGDDARLREASLVRIKLLEARLARLEAEAAMVEARREVLPLRRDEAVREVTRLDRAVAHWTPIMEALQVAAGEAAVADAEQSLEEVSAAYPVLERLARETRALLELRSGDDGLPRRIARARADGAEARVLLEETDRRFTTASDRIQRAGLTESMGLILRRDFEWLGREAAIRRRLSRVQADLADELVTEISLEERRSELVMDSDARAYLAGLGVVEPGDGLVGRTSRLLTDRRDALADALEDLGTLVGILNDHATAARRYVDVAVGYRAYIGRRILWVPSTATNPATSVLAIPAHAGELVRHSSWSLLGSTLAAAGLSLGLFVLLVIVLIALRKRLRQHLGTWGGQVRSYKTDRYAHTVRALAVVVLTALPGPLLAAGVGAGLRGAEDELLRALGSALRDLAGIWLALRFLKRLAAEAGVAQIHLRWPAARLDRLRRELLWFEPVALPLWLVALTLDRQGTIAWSDSLGRASFVSLMLVQAILVRRLFGDPDSGGLWLGRLHKLWAATLTLIPLILAGLAIGGLYYAALQFEVRVRYSVALALALLLANAMMLRWLFITRRNLAVSQALEARAHKDREAEAQGVALESGVVVDAEKVDIPALDQQTRQLFRSSVAMSAVVALYLVWASVLPALQGLDRVQLLPSPQILPTTVEHETREVRPAGIETAPAIPGFPTPTALESEDLPASLTLDEVLLALVFLVLLVVATKNVPALLELSVLRRLPLDRGARDAVSTIVRYLILVVGVSAVSGAVGIGWSQVQWLVAALTFGLAFGLQEIFANLVSGVIILLERPVRVGDIVTVDGIEGRVTELRMRATVVQDWDRRELLVPNKAFITNSIVNWTLTDPVNRIVLTIGVAYGSDVQRARRILTDITASTKHVLADPKPQVIFRNFGESSLDFEVRVFIADRDYFPQVVNRLHTEIEREFREAGVEIPFPQRDLHVRGPIDLAERGAPTDPS